MVSTYEFTKKQALIKLRKVRKWDKSALMTKVTSKKNGVYYRISWKKPYK